MWYKCRLLLKWGKMAIIFGTTAKHTLNVGLPVSQVLGFPQDCQFKNCQSTASPCICTSEASRAATKQKSISSSGSLWMETVNHRKLLQQLHLKMLMTLHIQSIKRIILIPSNLFLKTTIEQLPFQVYHTSQSNDKLFRTQ